MRTFKKDYQYDVALSFAGEDREYVEEVALHLKNFGVKVFYDKFEITDLWGKNLYDYLQDIYKNKARFTIIFISKHYKNKPGQIMKDKQLKQELLKNQKNISCLLN